jgi:hypothetical protein
VYRARVHAEILLRLGQVRASEGDLAGAAADWRRASTILASFDGPSREDLMTHACCHALLSALPGRADEGVSGGDADVEAAKAMSLLRRAVAGGFRNIDHFTHETAPDPLRSRPDFRLLMSDLAFPRDPFAW